MRLLFRDHRRHEGDGRPAAVSRLRQYKGEQPRKASPPVFLVTPHASLLTSMASSARTPPRTADRVRHCGLRRSECQSRTAVCRATTQRLRVCLFQTRLPLVRTEQIAHNCRSDAVATTRALAAAFRPLPFRRPSSPTSDLFGCNLGLSGAVSALRDAR